MLIKSLDAERLIHSVKTTVACLIGVVLTEYTGLTSAQWIVITIIVVMCAQIYVGSVLQKSYYRFIGTFIGSVFASLALIFFGHSNVSIMIAIGLSSLVFSYLAIGYENWIYAGTLGATTTAIIMLSDTPTLTTALIRFLEVSLGIAIATVVSQFLLPIHARTHLRKTQIEMLIELRAYYKKMIIEYYQKKFTENYQTLDETMVNNLLKQRQLAKESKREFFGMDFNREDFLQTLYDEKELLRAITFMHIALSAFKNIENIDTFLPILKQFNLEIIAIFDRLIKLVVVGEKPKKQINLEIVETLKREMTGYIKDYPEKEIIHINGFLFAAEMLVANLDKLIKIYY